MNQVYVLQIVVWDRNSLFTLACVMTEVVQKFTPIYVPATLVNNAV